MRTLEKTICARIRTILAEKGIRQVELAERAGITQGYLNELMNLHPKKRWNADHVEKVANALKVPTWQLFVEPREVLPKDYIEWKAGYDALDSDNKRIVTAMLKAAVVSKNDAPPARASKKRSAT